MMVLPLSGSSGIFLLSIPMDYSRFIQLSHLLPNDFREYLPIWSSQGVLERSPRSYADRCLAVLMLVQSSLTRLSFWLVIEILVAPCQWLYENQRNRVVPLFWWESVFFTLFFRAFIVESIKCYNQFNEEPSDRDQKVST